MSSSRFQQALFVLGLSVFVYDSEALPITSNFRGDSNLDNTRFLLLRNARDAGIIGKAYDFSFCSQGVQLYLGRKRLNRRNVRFSSLDAAEVTSHLHGETLEERAEVWCETAITAAIMGYSIGKTSVSFQVKDLDFWQGDVIISSEQATGMLGLDEAHPRRSKRSVFTKWRAAAKEAVKHREKRKIISGRIFEWPNQEVPWRFDKDANFSTSDKEDITAAIDHWEKNTCFKFTETANPITDHIRFIKDKGCFSFIGRQSRGSRGQDVSIGNGCTLLGIAAHTIGHALGFFHEHVRPDRDRYIDILLNNIGTQFLGNFQKQHWKMTDTAGMPYDYSSVMHYGPTDFSKDPPHSRTTITAHIPYLEKTMGQRESLSFFDIKAANYKFCSRNCGQKSLEWDRCKHGGYRNPRKCDECQCPRAFEPPFCEEMAKYGRVNCGPQVLQATSNFQILESPGYLSTGHPASSGCAWYIQAPVGKVIEFTFTGSFGMQVPNPRTLPCEDGYIEMRYQGVVRSGPRFCTERPRQTFTSEGQEMLVRTRIGSKKVDGFQAEFRAVEMQCGGCGSNPGLTESPCVRTLLSDCSISSPSRLNRCFSSLPDCCAGYTLVGQVCRRDTNSVVSPQTAPPTTTTSTTTTTTPRPTTTTSTTTTTTPPPTTTTTTTTTTTPVPTTTTTTTTPRPTTTTTTTPRPTTTSTTTTTTTPRPTTTSTTTTTTAPRPTTTPTTTTTAARRPTTTPTITTTTPEPTTTTTTTTTPEPTTTTTTTTTPEPTTTTTTTPVPTTTTTTTPEPTTTTTTTTTTPRPTTTTTTTPAPTTTTTTTQATTSVVVNTEEGWGDWGNWGTCSANCGLCGRALRTRRCINPPCSGNSVQVGTCPNTACPNVPRTRVCIDNSVRCGWWSGGSNRNGTCVRTKICVDEGTPCCKGTLENSQCVL